MIKPVIEAARTVDEMSKLKKGLEWMRDNTLLVGIPDSGERKSKKGKKSKVTNAELLFIHTNGSPVNNIPKRPVIEPAIIPTFLIQPFRQLSNPFLNPNMFFK